MFVFSAAIPLLVAGIGYKLFNKRVAAIGLILASLYPGFVVYSGFLLSEIPATFFLLLSFWLLSLAIKNKEKNMQLLLAAAAGLAFGAAAAVRSTVLLSGLLAGLLLLFFARQNRRIYLLLLAASGTVILFLVPLTARCSLLDNQFCLISSNGPLGILQGHYGTVGHFGFEDKSLKAYYEFGNPTTLQAGNEDWKTFQFGPYDQRAANQAAFGWIGAHPAQALWDSTKHIRDLYWGSVPWPPSNTTDRRLIIASERLFKLLVLLPAVIYSLALVSRSFRRKIKDYRYDLLLIVPILGIMLTVFITVAEPRYRLPFDGFFILLAARGYDYWFYKRSKTV